LHAPGSAATLTRPAGERRHDQEFNDMASAPGRAPKAGPGQTRADQIRIAASRLFVEKGYDRTSVQDIADAVGLTKAGLYHFVDSKEQLLRLILDIGMGRTEREVIAPAREVPDPAERLATYIRLHIGNISLIDEDGGNPVTAVTENMVGLSGEVRGEINARLRKLFELVRGALEDLRAQDRLAPDLDTTVAAFSIIGMVMWTNRWRRPQGKLSPREIADNIVRLALHGVLKPAA
jgi:AcrR family transcriptional regulator